MQVESLLVVCRALTVILLLFGGVALVTRVHTRQPQRACH